MELIADPVLPPLSLAEYEALKESIRERGVLVPILVAADRDVAGGKDKEPFQNKLVNFTHPS